MNSASWPRPQHDGPAAQGKLQHSGRTGTGGRRGQRRATETSQELEAVINGVRGGVARLELTDNLRVLWANAGFYALAGRSHAEYEQDVHDEALLVVHPDDRAHLLGAFRSSLASNIPVHTEYRILRRDGGVVWIYLQASLVGHRDGVPVFQGAVRDAQQAEKHHAGIGAGTSSGTASSRS